jgi:hypothetical protein
MAGAKNMMLSPAVQDLGLGDALKQQLDDAEMERRKKMLLQAQQMNQGLNPATQSLFAGGYGG